MRAARAGLDLQAICHVAGFHPAPARVLEVSRTGSQLCIERELAPGTLLNIAFDPGVADDPRREKPTVVTVRGRVVRLVASSMSQYIYGINLHIDDETASTLQWLALLYTPRRLPRTVTLVSLRCSDRVRCVNDANQRSL